MNDLRFYTELKEWFRDKKVPTEIWEEIHERLKDVEKKEAFELWMKYNREYLEKIESLISYLDVEINDRSFTVTFKEGNDCRGGQEDLKWVKWYKNISNLPNYTEQSPLQNEVKKFIDKVAENLTPNRDDDKPTPEEEDQAYLDYIATYFSEPCDPNVPF